MIISEKPMGVGEKARVVSIPDQNEDNVSLNDFEEKKVLLSFHPLAWTSVCRKQMESLEENFRKFENLHTVPLGLSVDPVPSKKAWADEMGLEKLKILSDFWLHGKVAKKYGVFNEEDGVSERANFLLDEERNVIFAKVYPDGEVPDLKEVFAAIEEHF